MGVALEEGIGIGIGLGLGLGLTVGECILRIVCPAHLVGVTVRV